MENYTDSLIEEIVNSLDVTEDTYELENNWIELHLTPSYLEFLATKAWVSNARTGESFYRNTLSLEERDTNLLLLQSLLPDVNYETKCELLKTNSSRDVDGYYVLFRFYTPDNEEKILDVWINAKDKFNNVRATRHIDQRSPSCLKVYKSIVTDGKVDVPTANYIVQCGSKTWDHSSPEAQTANVQFKLNSWTSEALFEDVLKISDIPYSIVDTYSARFYKGSPGNRSDFIITIDGITCKIDIKLLLTNDKIAEQAAHDADIVIGTELLSKNVDYLVVNDSKNGEKMTQLPKFKQLLLDYKARLVAAKNCYLKINSIDLQTGEISYSHFN